MPLWYVVAFIVGVAGLFVAFKLIEMIFNH